MSITLTAGQTKRLDVSLTPVYTPPPLGAMLWGYVKDANTGAAIEDVKIELIGVSLSYYSFAYSDSNGRYELADNPAGTYTVGFSHPDYETKEV